MSDAWDGRPPAGTAEMTAHELLAAPTEGGRVRFHAVWESGRWSSGGGFVQPATAAEWDWQYVGPCTSPADHTRLTARVAKLEAALRTVQFALRHDSGSAAIVTAALTPEPK